MAAGINILGEQIAEFCRRHRIRKLSLFGSVLRDDFSPDSDVDVLVEFEPGVKVGMIKLAGIEIDLGKILGRNVDMNTPKCLSPHFKDEILGEAEVQYEQDGNDS